MREVKEIGDARTELVGAGAAAYVVGLQSSGEFLAEVSRIVDAKRVREPSSRIRGGESVVVWCAKDPLISVVYLHRISERCDEA